MKDGDQNKSDYDIIETESSFCPLCNKRIFLMSYGGNTRLPSFYICFDCQRIAEVGVGVVEKYKEKGDEE